MSFFNFDESSSTKSNTSNNNSIMFAFDERSVEESKENSDRRSGFLGGPWSDHDDPEPVLKKSKVEKVGQVKKSPEKAVMDTKIPSHSPASNNTPADTSPSATHKNQNLHGKESINDHNNADNVERYDGQLGAVMDTKTPSHIPAERYDGQLGAFLKEAVEMMRGEVASLEPEVRRQEEAGAGILARTAGLGEDIRQYRHQLAATRTQYTARLNQVSSILQNKRNGEK